MEARTEKKKKKAGTPQHLNALTLLQRAGTVVSERHLPSEEIRENKSFLIQGMELD